MVSHLLGKQAPEMASEFKSPSLRYKDPEGVLRPIPASGYQEAYRKSTNWNVIPYESCIDRWSGCHCQCVNKYKGEGYCDKYKQARTLPKRCIHYRGFCGLSIIDEIDMIKAMPDRELPLLIGFLKTELGMEELRKRFKNVTI